MESRGQPRPESAPTGLRPPGVFASSFPSIHPPPPAGDIAQEHTATAPLGGPDSLPPSRHPASGLRLCAPAHERQPPGLPNAQLPAWPPWSRLPQKVRRSASRTPLTCLPAMLSLSGARAWCALRPGLPPNEPVSKSGAERASNTWAVLFWRARSHTVGIPIGRLRRCPVGGSTLSARAAAATLGDGSAAAPPALPRPGPPCPRRRGVHRRPLHCSCPCG